MLKRVAAGWKQDTDTAWPLVSSDVSAVKTGGRGVIVVQIRLAHFMS